MNAGPPMNTKWHLDQVDIDRYLAGHADLATASSLDSHVLACAECRARVTASVEARRPGHAEQRWAAISAWVDVASRPWWQRIAEAVGIPGHLARLAVATPALVAAWFAALVLSVGFALLAASSSRSQLGLILFLTLAPLVPMAGSTLLYSLQGEPPREMALATPARGPRLHLIRTTFVLVTSVPALCAAGLLLPGSATQGLAWLLPGLALAATPLALARFVDPVRTAVVLAIGWAAFVTTTAASEGRVSMNAFLENFAPLQPWVQVASALIAGVALWPAIMTVRELAEVRR